jgi:hypothetical protein
MKAKQVGHFLHIFGLHTSKLTEKFKVNEKFSNENYYEKVCENIFLRSFHPSDKNVSTATFTTAD